MSKMSPWLYKIIKASGEKPTKAEIEAAPSGHNFVALRCRCCGERLLTKRGLTEHYAILHPDLDRGWITGEERVVPE